MGGKYVPPHLRNKQGGQGNQNQAAASNRNSGGYINNRWSGQRQDNGNFQNQDYRPRFGRPSFQQPQNVISFVQKQQAKGLDPFKKQMELEIDVETSTTTTAETQEKPSRFAAWDSRSSNKKKSPLGFNGDLSKQEEKQKELFSQVKSTGINYDKYDAIPVEVSGEGAPGPLEAFDCVEAEKLLPRRLLYNLKLCGYKKPTPVQKHSVPIGMANRDLMACAQTGSGKTGGFLFPIISILLSKGALTVEFESRNRKARPNALVLAPTRELAIQIHEEAEKFCFRTGIRPVVVYGGQAAKLQRSELSSGCDILVATPGRLLDFMVHGVVELKCVQVFVLDEADRMLDMGFEPNIRKIVHEMDMPSSEDRRTFMFSATFPDEIQKLAQDFMEDYIFLTVGRVGSAAKDIVQSFEYVEERNKSERIIHTLNGIQSGKVLIFVQTKRGAEGLALSLQRENFPTSSIHGDRSQSERELALAAFKSGETPILVATDVAARGLDVDNVTMVINYDLPSNIDDYVHRIGRTGRAGNKGVALSYFNDKNSNIASKLLVTLKENNQKIPQFLQRYAHGGYRNNSGGGGYRHGGRDYRQGYKQRSYERGGNNNSGGGNRNSGSGYNRNTGGGSNRGRRFGGGGGRSNAGGGVTDAW